MTPVSRPFRLVLLFNLAVLRRLWLLTRVTARAGLPAYLTHTSQRSASNHVGDPDIALHANVSVSDAFQASPSPSRLAVTPRRIEFVSCGPPVRFRLLSTPPHDDAVTFSYGVLAYSGTDLHRAMYAPSRAH